MSAAFGENYSGGLGKIPVFEDRPRGPHECGYFIVAVLGFPQQHLIGRFHLLAFGDVLDDPVVGTQDAGLVPAEYDVVADPTDYAAFPDNLMLDRPDVLAGQDLSHPVDEHLPVIGGDHVEPEIRVGGKLLGRVTGDKEAGRAVHRLHRLAPFQPDGILIIGQSLGDPPVAGLAFQQRNLRPLPFGQLMFEQVYPIRHQSGQVFPLLAPVYSRRLDLGHGQELGAQFDVVEGVVEKALGPGLQGLPATVPTGFPGGEKQHRNRRQAFILSETPAHRAGLRHLDIEKNYVGVFFPRQANCRCTVRGRQDLRSGRHLRQGSLQRRLTGPIPVDRKDFHTMTHDAVHEITRSPPCSGPVLWPGRDSGRRCSRSHPGNRGSPRRRRCSR